MAMLTTQGIRVGVQTSYHADDSRPDESKFLFHYKVRIQNEGTECVQLMRRKWYIFDSMSGQRTVEGEGVIGEQPELEPGQAHSYSSWCPLISGIGSMHGYYFMRHPGLRECFKVRIPRFELIAPFKMS